jgi:hypothetical protein
MNNNEYFIPSLILARKKRFSFDLSHLDRKVCKLQLLLVEVRRGPFCSILPYTQSWEVGTNCMMKYFMVHYGSDISKEQTQHGVYHTRYGFEPPITDNRVP